MQSVFRQSLFIDPCRETLRFPCVRNQSIASHVAILCLWICPSAITWLIVSVSIYPINGGSSWWSFSHVGKEVLKFIPPFANTDSSGSINFESFSSFRSAPSEHGVPRFVSSRLAHAVDSIILGLPAKVAATIGEPSGLESVRASEFFLSAITKGFPINTSVFVLTHYLFDYKHSETLPGKVFSGMTVSAYNYNRHDSLQSVSFVQSRVDEPTSSWLDYFNHHGTGVQHA